MDAAIVLGDTIFCEETMLTPLPKHHRTQKRDPCFSGIAQSTFKNTVLSELEGRGWWPGPRWPPAARGPQSRGGFIYELCKTQCCGIDLN